MTAATWDSPYLLSMFNRVAGRPASDAITDPTKYQWLSEAQNEVVAMLGTIAPSSLYPKVAYGSIPTLTTTDNQIFTFGTDANGYAMFPMGKAGIFRSLNDIPDSPMREGRDFISEGTQIRIPNNQTYTGTLYWYGIGQPTDIDATHQPALLPEASRALIVVLAVKNFAESAVRNPALADRMLVRLGHPWLPSGAPGEFARWCLTWRTQFCDGGALNLITGMRLALSGQYNSPC